MKQKRFFDGWQLSTIFIAFFVLVPLIVVLLSFLYPTRDIWQHLLEYVLPGLLVNTFWLVISVFTVTLVLGVSLAWLTAVCEFPGRRIFSWSLLLPLAIPTYVFAFVSLGLFDFSGPVQTHLRTWFGPEITWFPNIRSVGGVVMVMSLALYPYVYLLARNAFLTQGKRALEVAQLLGYSRTSGFFRVTLPMARPWIVGGSMLVIMETLADFGAVSIFNYDTFTTAIYKAWFGLFSLPAAAQLASILILIVFVIFLVEQRMRSRMRFTQAGKHSMEINRIPLKGASRWLAFCYASLVMVVAFIIPVSQLIFWSSNIFYQEYDMRYLEYLSHSLLLGIMGALIICSCALVLSYSNRRHSDNFTRSLVRIATLGYALPGTVLAVGIFIPIASLDNAVIYLAERLFSKDIGPLLQGTLFVMMIAYIVRFMAPAFLSVNSAMYRIKHSLDEVSRLMGLKGVSLLSRVYLPILKGGMLTAATLVFVDIMKEMPITLMTRPFGWETLAVKIFELTSEGEWERAALPATALVLTGLLPIIFLTKYAEK
jgi:iron(III) transport system permease protein